VATCSVVLRCGGTFYHCLGSAAVCEPPTTALFGSTVYSITAACLVVTGDLLLLMLQTSYSAVMTESQGAAIPTSASVNALLDSKMLAAVSALSCLIYRVIPRFACALMLSLLPVHCPSVACSS
jgi:hypothetical protein